MANLKNFYAIIILLIIPMILPMNAQNLMAKQMNIYFGSPKKVTMTNSQGTIITEFDRNGRITNSKQGNMSVSYNWSEDWSEVTLSMYQGANFQDRGDIKIIENTNSRLKYDIGGVQTMDITFKENRALDKAVLTNPQISGTITYFYHQESDIYPYAIEQTIGDQSVKISVTIDETDSLGNAVVCTQELMGNKEVSRLTIEYY